MLLGGTIGTQNLGKQLGMARLKSMGYNDVIVTQVDEFKFG